MTECRACKLTNDPERHARVHEFMTAIESAIIETGTRMHGCDGTRPEAHSVVEALISTAATVIDHCYDGDGRSVQLEKAFFRMERVS